MNILYISALEGGLYSGPLYSVPKQIQAQSKVDNVYWVNLTNIQTADRFDDDIYHYIPLGKFRFSLLPEPFHKPDLIIFEEFFKIGCCKVGRDAERKGIPYIIVPRGQMTGRYIANKKLKKTIASFIIFSHFAAKALAVQFLTEQEWSDSLKYYSGKYYITHNGIDIPEQLASVKKENKYVGSFVGRYSIVQKGLDLFIEAVKKEEQLLLEKNIVFELYGPEERSGSSQDIIELVNANDVGNLVHVNGPVFDEEKKEVLLNSDFFIHTSRFEGMPMSVLEALSYGLPCLVTTGSNLKEDVEEFDAGWGALDQIEDIALALRSIALNLHSLQAKSKNAVKLAEKFSWDTIAKQSHDYFADFLK